MPPTEFPILPAQPDLFAVYGSTATTSAVGGRVIGWFLKVDHGERLWTPIVVDEGGLDITDQFFTREHRIGSRKQIDEWFDGIVVFWG